MSTKTFSLYPTPRPNPANEVMRKDLKSYEALKARLVEEQAAWEQALAEAKRHLENSTELPCDAGGVDAPLPSWLPAARVCVLSRVYLISRCSPS